MKEEKAETSTQPENSRREFMKKAGVVAAGVAAASAATFSKAPYAFSKSNSIK